MPLDYFPGFILALARPGDSAALREGGGCCHHTSLTRGAQYLHRVRDLCESAHAVPQKSLRLSAQRDAARQRVYQYVSGCAIGRRVRLSAPPVLNSAYPGDERNLVFTDGERG